MYKWTKQRYVLKCGGQLNFSEDQYEGMMSMCDGAIYSVMHATRTENWTSVRGQLYIYILLLLDCYTQHSRDEKLQ